ncbi:unnamed protein product [Heligmosomoides polygyrus]|uniref:Uncharacterized protein n=1 Tax=Heligmosomoides polygyrus TaxID=6339 RepID=A0A183FKH4_HELPZ|nr:unnamed protein product [Heligmosomoides polygyrus]
MSDFPMGSCGVGAGPIDVQQSRWSHNEDGYCNVVKMCCLIYAVRGWTSNCECIFGSPSRQSQANTSLQSERNALADTTTTTTSAFAALIDFGCAVHVVCDRSMFR